jgi:DNA-binding transcriptional regulator YiaG
MKTTESNLAPDISVKEVRERLELTQVEFASLLGVSFATVNRWENKHCHPSPLAVEKLKNIVSFFS